LTPASSAPVQVVALSKRSGQRRGLEAPAASLRVLGRNTVARRLYSACGFVNEGTLRAEFLRGGRYVDDVLMACALIKESEPRA
jgi:RimJ/RimL family protein N-acetyltransferase